MLNIINIKSKISFKYLYSLSSKWSLTILMAFSQFLLIPLYIKYLGKETFGIITLILSAKQFMDFGVGWISGGSLRILSAMEAKKDSYGFNKVYSSLKIGFSLYGLIFIILIWIGLPFLIKDLFKDIELVTSLVIASINIILIYSFSADRAAFGAKKWQFKSDISAITSQIVTAFCVFLILENFKS